MSSERADESALIAALLAGDEAAFLSMVEKHHETMVRVARTFLPARGVAEEVVQDTWLAIMGALPRFEQRSSLKTWMFRILANRARSRARKEGRSLPMSALGKVSLDGSPAVDPERFTSSGHWKQPPERWATPENGTLSTELGGQIREAIETLPERQRLVIELRDVKGWSSGEVCNVLEISETNQRVLLHRARTKVRHALAVYLEGAK